MSDQSPSLRFGPARCAWAVAAMTVTATTGFWLSMTSPEVRGTESLTIEDAVDVIAMLCFGVLGALLVVRRRAAGLGVALMLMTSMECLSYLLGGLADAIADGQTDPPALARLCNVTSQASFIVAFFLLAVAPALLFPTGRPISTRWRPVAWAAAIGVLASVLSLLLAPGPVDEDVTAWGDNPLGVEALAPVTDTLAVFGMVLLVASAAAGIAATVTRWVRYRGPRRRQMAWFSAGLGIQLVGLAVDLDGSTPAVEVLLALTIFSGLLLGLGVPLLGPLGIRAEEADRLAGAHPERENAPA